MVSNLEKAYKAGREAFAAGEPASCPMERLAVNRAARISWYDGWYDGYFSLRYDWWTGKELPAAI